MRVIKAAFPVALFHKIPVRKTAVMGAPMLAWLLCSARQAWKDGFFGALGGVAHQLVTGKCMGDDRCMYIITLKDQ